MQLKRVLNAFKKNNIQVDVVSPGYSYRAVMGDRVLHFHENGRNSQSILTFVAKHPETNASVDLFMDTYFDTLKGAVKYLKNGGF